MSKKPLKICIISLDASPLFGFHEGKSFGGAEVELYLLGKYLAKRDDFKISFIVDDLGGASGPILRENITLHELLHSFCLPFLRLMRKINADIYVSSSSGKMVGKWALFAKLLGKKFAYLVASDIDCDGGIEKRMSFVDSLWYRLGLKLSDVIVAQNTHQRNLLDQRGYCRVVVVKKGLDGETGEIREDGREYLLWVGRCTESKRPEIFLDLARKFTQEKFLMVCPPSGESAEFFEKIHTEATTPPNLKFSAGEKYADMENVYKKAKLFVLTSDFEGDLPLVVLESFKYGVPVLSLTINPDGCFDDNRLGLFAGGDVKILEQQIKLLLADRALYLKYQNAGRKYFDDFYNMESIVLTFATLFREGLILLH